MNDLFAPGLVTEARRAGPQLNRAIRHQNERMARRLRTTRGGGVLVSRSTKRTVMAEPVVALDSDSAAEECVPSLLMAALAASPPPKLKKTRKLKTLKQVPSFQSAFRSAAPQPDRTTHTRGASDPFDEMTQENASMVTEGRKSASEKVSSPTDRRRGRARVRAPVKMCTGRAQRRRQNSVRRHDQSCTQSGTTLSPAPVESPAGTKLLERRLQATTTTPVKKSEKVETPGCKEWNPTEDAQLLREVKKMGGDPDAVDWDKLALLFPPASGDECRIHHWSIFISHFNASATASAVKKKHVRKPPDSPAEEFNKKDPTKAWKMLSELNRRALCKKSHDIFDGLDEPKEAVRCGRRSWGLSSLMSDFANSASPAPVSPLPGDPLNLADLLGEELGSAEPDGLTENRFQERHRKQQLKCRLRVSLSQDDPNTAAAQKQLPPTAINRMLKNNEKPRFARRQSLEIELDNAGDDDERKMIIMEIAHATQDGDDENISSPQSTQLIPFS